MKQIIILLGISVALSACRPDDTHKTPVCYCDPNDQLSGISPSIREKIATELEHLKNNSSTISVKELYFERINAYCAWSQIYRALENDPDLKNSLSAVGIGFWDYMFQADDRIATSLKRVANCGGVIKTVRTTSTDFPTSKLPLPASVTYWRLQKIYYTPKGVVPLSIISAEHGNFNSANNQDIGSILRSGIGLNPFATIILPPRDPLMVIDMLSPQDFLNNFSNAMGVIKTAIKDLVLEMIQNNGSNFLITNITGYTGARFDNLLLSQFTAEQLLLINFAMFISGISIEKIFNESFLELSDLPEMQNKLKIIAAGDDKRNLNNDGGLLNRMKTNWFREVVYVGGLNSKAAIWDERDDCTSGFENPLKPSCREGSNYGDIVEIYAPATDIQLPTYYSNENGANGNILGYVDRIYNHFGTTASASIVSAVTSVVTGIIYNRIKKIYSRDFVIENLKMSKIKELLLSERFSDPIEINGKQKWKLNFSKAVCASSTISINRINLNEFIRD